MNRISGTVRPDWDRRFWYASHARVAAAAGPCPRRRRLLGRWRSGPGAGECVPQPPAGLDHLGGGCGAATGGAAPPRRARAGLQVAFLLHRNNRTRRPMPISSHMWSVVASSRGGSCGSVRSRRMVHKTASLRLVKSASTGTLTRLIMISVVSTAEPLSVLVRLRCGMTRPMWSGVGELGEEHQPQRRAGRVVRVAQGLLVFTGAAGDVEPQQPAGQPRPNRHGGWLSEDHHRIGVRDEIGYLSRKPVDRDGVQRGEHVRVNGVRDPGVFLPQPGESNRPHVPIDRWPHPWSTFIEHPGRHNGRPAARAITAGYARALRSCVSTRSIASSIRALTSSACAASNRSLICPGRPPPADASEFLTRLLVVNSYEPFRHNETLLIMTTCRSQMRRWRGAGHSYQATAPHRAANSRSPKGVGPGVSTSVVMRERTEERRRSSGAMCSAAWSARKLLWVLPKRCQARAVSRQYRACRSGVGSPRSLIFFAYSSAVPASPSAVRIPIW